MTLADGLGVAATVDNAFLLAFSSLFSIINPVGGALIQYVVFVFFFFFLFLCFFF